MKVNEPQKIRHIAIVVSFNPINDRCLYTIHRLTTQNALHVTWSSHNALKLWTRNLSTYGHYWSCLPFIMTKSSYSRTFETIILIIPIPVYVPTNFMTTLLELFGLWRCYRHSNGAPMLWFESLWWPPLCLVPWVMMYNSSWNGAGLEAGYQTKDSAIVSEGRTWFQLDYPDTSMRDTDL